MPYTHAQEQEYYQRELVKLRAEREQLIQSLKEVLNMLPFQPDGFMPKERETWAKAMRLLYSPENNR